LAAKDFSRAGETFIDLNGESHEILYSILTPLGYQARVSVQALKHIEKHPIASQHTNDIAHILNNPDLVTPNPGEPETHVFYKVFEGKWLFALPVQIKDATRFVATMYKATYIKGLKQNRLSANDFHYLRGGFKWKKWQ